MGALCSCVPGCGGPVRLECGQVAWFPQLASSSGSADIHSQINPAVNCSVVAPQNHLWRAKMEMIKRRIWTSVMFKVFGRKDKHWQWIRQKRLWLHSNSNGRLHFSPGYRNSAFRKSTGLEPSKIRLQVTPPVQVQPNH